MFFQYILIFSFHMLCNVWSERSQGGGGEGGEVDVGVVTRGSWKEVEEYGEYGEGGGVLSVLRWQSLKDETDILKAQVRT